MNDSIQHFYKRNFITKWLLLRHYKRLNYKFLNSDKYCHYIIVNDQNHTVLFVNNKIMSQTSIKHSVSNKFVQHVVFVIRKGLRWYFISTETGKYYMISLYPTDIKYLFTGIYFLIPPFKASHITKLYYDAFTTIRS